MHSFQMIKKPFTWFYYRKNHFILISISVSASGRGPELIETLPACIVIQIYSEICMLSLVLRSHVFPAMRGFLQQLMERND